MRIERNENVEKAAKLLIGLVDKLTDGQVLGAPPLEKVKSIYDSHVENQGGSVRLACAFFAAYAMVDEDWDFNSVPTGTRGQYGDKLLGSELTLRNVTFHKNVTAFGENLGWKGNVRQVDLSRDERFSAFLSNLRSLSKINRRKLLNHIAWKLQSSRVVPQALPPLPSTYLSYARSLSLCERLIAIPSEGHIQQFLVAAFIEIHRRRFGHRVVTHHPHASDKFDGTVGDIEEFKDDNLFAAYEVTVRDDWKNRLADFGKKVAQGQLPKYVIIASGVRNDPDLYPARQLVDFVRRLTFDLAVVDISDFFSVFCAELFRGEIEFAFNRTYEMLTDPRLCGREDFVRKYREVTNDWLDT